MTAYDIGEIERTVRECEARIRQLEKLVQYPNSQTVVCGNSRSPLKTYEVKGQAAQHLYAPLRNDTKAVLDLAAFARRLLDPQDLGHAVTQEVRNAARRALSIPEVHDYDL